MKAVIALTCGCSSEEGRYYVREAYVRCIEAAGGIPLLVPPLEDQGDIQHLLRSVDGVLLPGGVDIDPILFGEEPMEGLGTIEPHWDRLELAAARFALASDLPILVSAGECRSLNVATSGSLYQDIASQTKGKYTLSTAKRRLPAGSATHSIKNRAQLAFWGDAGHQDGQGKQPSPSSGEKYRHRDLRLLLPVPMGLLSV